MRQMQANKANRTGVVSDSLDKSTVFGVSAGLVVNHGAVLGSEMSQEFREIRWCVEKEVDVFGREERKYLVDEMYMHVSRYVCM